MRLVALTLLGALTASTVRGSGSPLTPRRKRRAAARGPKPLKPPSGGKNATNPEPTTPEEAFVANTTATTKRFTGPKTAARLALALLQGCVLAPRSCAYTFRSVVSSVKKKLGREGVTFSEEGVDDFITVYGGGAGPDATTWDDVVGAPAAVSELRRILRVAGAADASQKARRAGATPPRNVLLAGPPGTGKTLIARAAAAQLDAPLLVASAAEIVKGKYAGVGVERVRTLFAAARRVAARSTGRLAVVFIDELDSCGRVRGGDASAVGADHDNTLNQLLVEMDGFGVRDASNPDVVVLAATNRRDMLDPALTRRGRFDRVVEMAAPDRDGREALFEHYVGKQRSAFLACEIIFTKDSTEVACQALNNNTLRVFKPVKAAGLRAKATLFANNTARLDSSDLEAIMARAQGRRAQRKTGEEDVPFDVAYEGGSSVENDTDLASTLADLSPGLVGADVAAVVNDAALAALDKDQNYATKDDYLRALEDAILGIPTHPDGASPKPDHRIAVHEAGHAVSSFFLEHVDEATRASVRPRSGGSLGVTMFGAGDATNLRRAELRDRVVMMLAGKAAEAHLLGDASTGAADDVRRAAVLAEAIVKTYGLSQDGAVFTSWVDEYGKRHAIGGEEADQAVRNELAEAERRALALVKDHEGAIRALADALVEHETLDAAALRAVIVPV
jgi:ATP-dependent Zn protease